MKHAVLLPAAIAFCLGAPALAQEGRYRLKEGPDVASELVLTRDGRFEYILAAGALDEQASGRWRKIGKTVRLTTEPAPVPAVFSAGAARRVSGEPFRLHAAWADGRPIVGRDVRIDFASGPPVEDYIASEDGFALPEEEKRVPVAVTLALPMYELVSPRFPLDARAANDFTFVLTPNDLGRIGFKDLVVDVQRDRLVMHRGTALLTYVRQRR